MAVTVILRAYDKNGEHMVREFPKANKVHLDKTEMILVMAGDTARNVVAGFMTDVIVGFVVS